MKAILFTHLVPTAANGESIYVARVLRAVQRLGFDVQLNAVVICPSGKEDVTCWIPELQIDGITYRTVRASFSFASFVPGWLKLLAAGLEDLRKADVVLYRLFWFQPVALLVRLFNRDCRVIWLHDGVVEEIAFRHANLRGRITTHVADWTERFFARYADVHLPVSAKMLWHTRAKGIRTRNGDLVMPCVVETDRFSPKFSPPHDDKPIVIGFAGSIARWHAFEEACFYVKFLEHHGWSVQLRVLTPALKAAEEIVAHVGVTATVESVPHHMVPKRMAQWHFALSPQRPGIVTEVCSPLKVTEALAMGLPVLIAPRVGDYSELIVEHGAGLVFDPAAPSTWNHTLSAFRALVDRYAYASRQARELAVRRFGMDQLDHILGLALGSTSGEEKVIARSK